MGGRDESDEGDEGHEGYEKGHEGTEGGDEGWWCHDADRCVSVGGRDHGLEDKGREGCRGCIHGRGRGTGEEVWLLQACGYAQHEAEEQAGHKGAQGRQPLHQGAVRFQGEACLENSALPSDEEAQGDALKRVPTHVAVGPTDECTWEYTGYGERVECGRSDEVLVGRCGSGLRDDCPGSTNHGSLCCEFDFITK